MTGFTLIEMSIVLVIIGLVVGGVLVGQDMIRAGEVRAQITQIEKFNSATNTFRGKFNALPGDLNATTAATFGFASRGSNAGEGDGNGIIQGWGDGGSVSGVYEETGETVMFWVDLSSAVAGNLIEGGFNAASASVMPGADITGTNLNLWLPQAKLGHGNYVYVWSGWFNSGGWGTNGINYFGLSAASNIAASSNSGLLESGKNIPVAQAYAIDKKVDDGMPQSGNVMAWYLNGNVYWTDGTAVTGANNQTTTAIAGSSTTCYDNGNVTNATQQYSLEINNGAGANCALSFKMQAGD
jgi:prepilin-type N-terminal cleavage/methylation domain-containing protein